MSAGSHLAFPFRVGGDGRSLTANTLDEQVLQELEQLVLTTPGERLFLPAFGGGVSRLVFESTDEHTIAVAKANLTQAIQTWLGSRLNLLSIDVSSMGSAIMIAITYQVMGSPSPVQAVFQRSAL